MRNVEWEYKFMERKEAENSNIAMEICHYCFHNDDDVQITAFRFC